MARNMERNTVHRVEFANTTKREKARRKAIADAERETYIPGPAERAVRQDALGGDTGGTSETPVSETAVSGTPVSEAPQNPGGPRIVVNPQVFSDKRDALCVAFNEAFRVVMEMNGFEPASEPTEKQRKFFADTAYADDELQLRRTILARIATLDTSVKDPTDEQLEETAEMLEMVMEVGAPQNEWEQAAVKRLHDVVVKSLESTRANGSGTPAPKEHGSARAAEGGGQTDEERRKAATQFAEERGMDTSSSADTDTQTLESVHRTHGEEAGGGAVPEAAETDSPGETGQPTGTHTQRDGGADTPADGQTPERAVAQRGPDGYYHDSNGRIVSQRTAQAELDRRRRGGNMV